MGFFVQTFNLILYQPILNVLILLYQYLPGRDFGLAIIVLTLLIRFLLYPLSQKSVVSQKVLADLQPKIKEIREKYKNDKEKEARALMELYRREKFNPFSGFLPFLIQIPILIALYRVFWKGFEANQMVYLYSFIPSPPLNFQPSFLGFINLAQPNLFLAFLAGFLQFWQTKMLYPKVKTKKEKNQKLDFSQIFQKQMLYFFPFFTFLILLKFPSAIALYWMVTSLFSIGQQYIYLKNKKAK